MCWHRAAQVRTNQGVVVAGTTVNYLNLLLLASVETLELVSMSPRLPQGARPVSRKQLTGLASSFAYSWPSGCDMAKDRLGPCLGRQRPSREVFKEQSGRHPRCVK